MIEPGPYTSVETPRGETLWVLTPGKPTEHPYFDDIEMFAYLYVYSDGRADQYVQTATMSVASFHNTWRPRD